MRYLSLLLLVSTIAAGAARAGDDEYSKNGEYIGVGASYGVRRSRRPSTTKATAPAAASTSIAMCVVP